MRAAERGFRTPALMPVWLRPSLLATLVAAHGAIFYKLQPPPTSYSPLDAIPVAVVALGDGGEDPQPQPDAAEPAPALAAPDPIAPPPPPVADEAPPLPAAPPKPTPRPTPVSVRSRKPEPIKPRRIVDSDGRENHRQAVSVARQDARRGAANGAESGGLSRADFGALVVEEINRRKFFPAAARDAGKGGAVGVAFTIGPAGRVVSQSIVRSSGSAALDDAARAILAALRTPPPPGGAFSARTSIRFELQ